MKTEILDTAKQRIELGMYTEQEFLSLVRRNPENLDRVAEEALFEDFDTAHTNYCEQVEDVSEDEFKSILEDLENQGDILIEGRICWNWHAGK